jgi:cell division protein FtsB
MKISFLRIGYACLVLAGIGYAFVELSGPNGINGMKEKREQVRQLEAENDQLHNEIGQKQQRIERLRNDPQAQEIEIRKRLKLAAPGEKVFIIDENGK